MSNINTETGIRFGVIAGNSLDPDLLDELLHGPGATDLSYQEAYEEAKKDAEHEFDAAVGEAEIAANEVDPNMPEEDFQSFIDKEIEATLGTISRAQYVIDKLEEFSDICQIDEPTIEGTYECVKYRISWLGGAPLLWVLEGPVGYCNQLCSPCVPGAGDLDSGFATGEVPNDCTVHTCYVLPQGWVAKEVA